MALPLHDHGTGKRWGVSVTPRRIITPGKDPVPIVQEVGWALRPVWTGAVNLALPIRIQSPGRLARSQSLHPINYPAQKFGRRQSKFKKPCVELALWQNLATEYLLIFSSPANGSWKPANYFAYIFIQIIPKKTSLTTQWKHRFCSL
jgi:hypothetical protein